MKDQYSHSKGKQNNQKPEASIDNELPTYRETGYKNEDGEYRIDFIVDYPMRIAEMISDRTKFKIADTENNNTQIRKFFELVRNVETSLQLEKINMGQALIEVNRLRPLVENAKKGGKITQCFVDFININLDKVKTAEDLVFFAKHFEAVIGFSKKDTKGGNRR